MNNKAKQKIKEWLPIVIILAVMLFAVVYLINYEEAQPEITPIKQVKVKRSSDNPYNPEWDKELPMPIVMFGHVSGGVFQNITDYTEEQRHEGHRFFIKYFDILRRGDYENYGSLFTETYKKDPIGFEKNFDREFPPQEIKNCVVKECYRNVVGEKYEGKDCTYSIYEVTFEIKNNDFLFRNDMDHGKARLLYFELVTFNAGTSNEATYIKNMYDQPSIENHNASK